MELIDEKWENYSTKAIASNNLLKHDEYWEEKKLETLSVGELYNMLSVIKRDIETNGQDIYSVPVFIKNNTNNSRICIDCVSQYPDSSCSLDFWEDDKLEYSAPDIRPDNGEYWASCGVGRYEVSGFVKSKLAGERLRRMVNFILENDEPNSCLDFRQSEPSLIQFKFNKYEFNIKKLDKMVKNNNGVVTEEILKHCKK